MDLTSDEIDDIRMMDFDDSFIHLLRASSKTFDVHSTTWNSWGTTVQELTCAMNNVLSNGWINIDDYRSNFLTKWKEATRRTDRRPRLELGLIEANERRM